MIFISITVLLCFILTVAWALDALDKIRPGHRIKFSFVFLSMLISGILIGTIIGEYVGQYNLLTSRKSFYSIEIKENTAYDATGRRYVKADTSYHLQLEPKQLVAPIANPSFYIHKKDTLWTTATFKYSLK